jgi:WD40 repeat protein
MPPVVRSLETILAAAVEIADGAERCHFVDRACAGDTELKRQVEELITNHIQAGSFLETPAIERAAAECGGPTRAAISEPNADDADEQTMAFLEPSQRPGALGRLGHYEVLERVGGGGMGVVYKAFDEQLHRVVAIKVMTAVLAGSATARKRFTREARAAAAVRNEHVIDIHAVEEAGRLPYLVMEYVSGRSLQERLDQSGPLVVTEVLRIGMQAAAALAAAHAQGLIHRDIKPANILLENGVERVKITDFGLARAGDDASLTQTGQVAGTPHYMAPEQARAEAVDHRADLFSLGSVLYAMCTGRPPFRAATSLAVLRCVVEETPPPIRELNADVPDWLAAIVARLHAKEPADRFQSAAEVAELLAHCLAHVREPAHVPLPTAPAAQTLPRRRSARIAAGLAVLLVAALAITELAGLTRLTDAVRSVMTPAEPPANVVPESAVTGASPSALDRLDPARIPTTERFAWQPRELVAVLGEHRGLQWGMATGIALSPDGKRAASWGYAGSVHIWDAETLALRALLKGHTGGVWGAAFSPDGHRLLSAGSDGTMRLWDVDAGQGLRRFDGHTGTVWCVAYARDGRHALSGGGDHTVRLWDIDGAKELKRFDGHTQGVNNVAFCPDGIHVLSGGQDNTVRLWKRDTGQEVRQWRAHSGPFRMALLPDGRHVLSGGEDGTVRLWDVETGQEVRHFDGHSDKVFHVACTRDGRRGISGGADGTMRLWELDTGQELHRVEWHRAIGGLTFAPDGRRALGITDRGNLRLWELDTGTELVAPSLPSSIDFPVRLAFTPDGGRVAASAYTDFCRVWDAASGRERRFELSDHLWSVAFTDGGRHLLGAGGSGMVVWDADSGRELRRFAGARRIWDIAVSRDERTVITAGLDGTVRWWDLDTASEVNCLRGHTAAVHCVALAPDGWSTVSGGADRSVRLWDLGAARQKHLLQAEGTAVWSVAYAADGRHVAAGTFDGFVRLWDVTGSQPRMQPLPKWHAGPVRAVAFSPDGRTLASACGAGRVILWDVTAGAKWREWQLPGEVCGVAFAPDGRHLAIANSNATVYIVRLGAAVP